MASTALSDLYDPLVFDAAADEAAIELNAFLNSGVMVQYPQIDDMASVGGFVGEMPFFKPLATADEPNYTSDDPTSFAVPAITTTGKQVYRLAKMHKSWSAMDFARELTLATLDPLGNISRSSGQYWATQEEKRVIQAAMGVYADNVANDASDMSHVIYDDIASPLAGNIISAEAILDCGQTAGDHQMMFTAIAMHSVTFNNLNKQNLIDYIPDSNGVVNFPVYLGKVVTVDDSLPVVAGSNSPAYMTILFAPGAFGYGVGRMLVPSELERVPSSGDGGGEDVIHTRRNPVIHPQGFAFDSSGIAGTTATLAELAEAAQWDRVVDRKNAGMAFLYHNN